MARRSLTTVAFLLVIAGACVSLGCSHYWAAEKTHRRIEVAKSDWNRAGDDLDWALGLDEPSIMYEDSLPPKP
jgi:hypothetical protein